MTHFKNILIVRTDRVGDVILTLPVIAALKENLPNARISILVSALTAELVQGHAGIDEVLLDDRKGTHSGLIGFVRLAQEIKRRRFDLALVFHTKKRTNLLCFLSGIPQRIGYRNNKFGFLLTRGLPDTRVLGVKHEAEYCLDVLRQIGLPCGPAKPHLEVHPLSRRWAGDFLQQHGVREGFPLVAIHPGASCLSKRWMPERFAEVANHLEEKYKARIIFIGGPENEQIMKVISPRLMKSALDATGQTTLSQLAALLERCRLLISNDSGPVHLAAALNIPVVSIFGRNQAGLSPLRWGPLGDRSAVIQKEVGCVICRAHDCQIDFKCLSKITSKEVLEAVDSLWRLC